MRRLLLLTLPACLGCAHATSDLPPPTRDEGERFFLTSDDGSTFSGELVGVGPTEVVLAVDEQLTCVPRGSVERMGMETTNVWRNPSLARIQAGGLGRGKPDYAPGTMESPDGHALMEVDLARLDQIGHYARYAKGPPTQVLGRCIHPSLKPKKGTPRVVPL